MCVMWRPITGGCCPLPEHVSCDSNNKQSTTARPPLSDIQFRIKIHIKYWHKYTSFLHSDERTKNLCFAQGMKKSNESILIELRNSILSKRIITYCLMNWLWYLLWYFYIYLSLFSIKTYYNNENNTKRYNAISWKHKAS